MKRWIALLACLSLNAQAAEVTVTGYGKSVDEALTKGAPTVRNVLVVRRTGQDVDWNDGRDVWWHDVVDSASDQHTAVDLPA